MSKFGQLDGPEMPLAVDAMSEMPQVLDIDTSDAEIALADLLNNAA